MTDTDCKPPSYKIKSSCGLALFRVSEGSSVFLPAGRCIFPELQVG